MLIAYPELLDPFKGAPEIVLDGPDVGTIRDAGAYHHRGEKVRLHRGPDGRPEAVQIAGDLWIGKDAFAAELAGRYG